MGQSKEIAQDLSAITTTNVEIGNVTRWNHWLFARQSIIIGQAGYGVASIAGLLHFAVYLDDLAM
jgi:hypothetical protein